MHAAPPLLHAHGRYMTCVRRPVMDPGPPRLLPPFARHPSSAMLVHARFPPSLVHALPRLRLLLTRPRPVAAVNPLVSHRLGVALPPAAVCSRDIRAGVPSTLWTVRLPCACDTASRFVVQLFTELPEPSPFHDRHCFSSAPSHQAGEKSSGLDHWLQPLSSWARHARCRLAWGSRCTHQHPRPPARVPIRPSAVGA